MQRNLGIKAYVLILVLALGSIYIGITYAYTPGLRDRQVMRMIDTKLDAIKETGGKERLAYIVTAITDRASTVEDKQSLYLLEYTLRRINSIMEEDFGFSLEWDPLVDDEMDMNELVNLDGAQEGTAENPTSITADDTSNSEPAVSGIDTTSLLDLEDFYRNYKGQVTSSIPISDLCTTYYDKIDAVAKEYDFPTALIIATWYREHTCKFSNPANGRGNFQIISHSYPPGNITWADFENQIVNFIIFSRAKRERYDSFQKWGPEPVNLTYDTIDLTSLRKHAVLYNGISQTLEGNVYANQNFGQAADGRDGIVAMTLRVLEWQLYGSRTLAGPPLQEEDVVVDVEDAIEEGEEVDKEDRQETEEEIISENCDMMFTQDLGPEANHPEVLALQEFLKDEGFYSGTPNGVYDDRTTQAVNAFQAFYKSDILDPGGYTAPTGYRYPATRRKANSLVCE